MSDSALTIRDIAQLADVSVATVSRVLNNQGGVKEKTRRRVLDVMKEYNYTPNLVARSLTTKKSMMLGCVLPDISNPFFSAVFLAIESHAVSLGYHLLLTNTMNSSELETASLNTLADKQVDGIFILGGRVNEESPPPRLVEEVNHIRKQIPVVLINGKLPGDDWYRVRADEAAGVAKIVNYLINIGHTDIALIGGLRGNLSTDIKVRAFYDAMYERGLSVPPEYVVHGGWSVASGIESMSYLLQYSRLPTAVVGINDLVAIGAMQVIQANGLHVPSDISVTGFDNTLLTEACSPRLTSVSQNYTRLGQIAAETMAALIAGEANLPEDQVVETELIIRDSCEAR